jgi:DNA-binding GntR family transcriptional regulator
LDTQAIRQRRTTPGMVADVLREAIRSGELKAGQPLRQDELAGQFGLSRIPVREALRQLEGEGLITVNPHRGAMVSILSSGELQEVCEIRVALECTAIRLAIPHLNGETLTRAAEILTETDRETDVLGHWSRNNWLFHSTLYLPAQRPRLLSMIKQLHDTVDRYLRLHVSVLNYKTKGQEEHWQLLDACRRRDADAAARLLEQHIETVAVLLAKYLPKDQPAPAAD